MKNEKEINDRVDNIFAVTGQAMMTLKTIRSLAQRRKGLSESDVQDIASLMQQLRHHVEMYNNERAR